MKLNPIYDRVLIKRHKLPEQTESGLYLPPVAQGKSNFAEVIAVGPGKLNEDGTLSDMSVKVGDTVLIGKWHGDEIVVDGEKCIIIKEGEILARIE